MDNIKKLPKSSETAAVHPRHLQRDEIDYDCGLCLALVKKLRSKNADEVRVPRSRKPSAGPKQNEEKRADLSPEQRGLLSGLHGETAVGTDALADALRKAKTTTEYSNDASPKT